MSVLSVARAEARQAEHMLKQHCSVCLGCFKWRRDGVATFCDIGPQLTDHVQRMQLQIVLLQQLPEDNLVQDTLF